MKLRRTNLGLSLAFETKPWVLGHAHCLVSVTSFQVRHYYLFLLLYIAYTEPLFQKEDKPYVTAYSVIQY